MVYHEKEHIDKLLKGEEIEPTTQLPSFDAITTGLLADAEIKKLPENEQGKVIADRFIGALLRHGDIAGSVDTYSPADNLKLIDTYGTSDKEDDTLFFTSKQGLRAAVQALAADARVRPELGHLEGRISRDETGKLVLTSVAQIEGYLMPGAHANYPSQPVLGSKLHGDQWVPVVMGEVQRLASDVTENWLSDARNRELAASDVELVKNGALDRLSASRAAEQVGVSIDLIRRSAEKIQARIEGRHDMGSIALSLATGSGVDEYNVSLERRSGL